MPASIKLPSIENAMVKFGNMYRQNMSMGHDGVVRHDFPGMVTNSSWLEEGKPLLFDGL